jgi:hypothetical protein
MAFRQQYAIGNQILDNPAFGVRKHIQQAPDWTAVRDIQK